MKIYHPQNDWTSWLVSVNINYYQFLHNAINLKAIVYAFASMFLEIKLLSTLSQKKIKQAEINVLYHND